MLRARHFSTGTSDRAAAVDLPFCRRTIAVASAKRFDMGTVRIGVACGESGTLWAPGIPASGAAAHLGATALAAG
jgi:hypothetical protein